MNGRPGKPHPTNPDKVRVPKDPPLQVYADFEAVTDEDGKQTPILVCFETDESNETVVCEGPNCTGELFEKLDAFNTDQDGKPREVIVIFHNLKGYDGMFLLQYCYDNQREVTDQLPVGAKILSFKSHDLTFKDSLCFLPFPLANFPATFGITELCKGFFPHKFNTLENQGYTGSMPPRDTYDPDGMSAKKKVEFEQWYQEKVDADYHFVLQDEMKAYCESDVKLLKAGCKKFRQEFKQHANFDPFEKCVTIASACNRYWRKKLVPQNTIASRPPRGWFGPRTNQSVKALKWLAWQEHLLRQQPSTSQAPGDRIRSVVNEGEMRVGPQRVLVDGYDETTNTVYEFHGCLWHGCPRCFKNSRHSTSTVHPDRTLYEVYDHTREKIKTLRDHGYRVLEKWECEWEQDIKTDPDLEHFLKTVYKYVDPLQPRDAFFGGRTNAVKLHHRVTGPEKIKYMDVTSLYPWVNKTREYPVGHPKIIVNPADQDIHSYFGMALVDVLPPYELYHPVLPYRHKGKLTFPLCRKCVEKEMPKQLLEKSHECDHTPEQRTLRGTWCTPELVKAVELGYEIKRIHEVWNFPPEQRKTGLFAD